MAAIGGKYTTVRHQVREQLVAEGEAIVQAVAEVNRGQVRPYCFGAIALQAAPEALLHRHDAGRRTPALEATGVRDLRADEAFTEIGRQRDDAGEFVGMDLGVGESAEAADRDADDPDRPVASRARRCDHVAAKPFEDGLVVVVADVRVDQSHVHGQLALGHGVQEALFDELVRMRVDAGQHHQQRVRVCSAGALLDGDIDRHLDGTPKAATSKQQCRNDRHRERQHPASF